MLKITLTDPDGFHATYAGIPIEITALKITGREEQHFVEIIHSIRRRNSDKKITYILYDGKIMTFFARFTTGLDNVVYVEELPILELTEHLGKINHKCKRLYPDL